MEETIEIVSAIKEHAVQTPRIESILENYFTDNHSFLWRDALEDHQLIAEAESTNG